MKTTSIAAVAGLFAAATVQAVGQARVVNQCSDPVYVQNTPCTQGMANIYKTLENGDDYSQDFTALSGGCGWSIKLATSQEILQSSSNILQYEYTSAAGIIWYDMSLVNGGSGANAPFPSYTLESSDPETCKPNNSIVFLEPVWPGMQLQCDDSISITLNLCATDGSSGSGSGSGSSASASAAATTSSSAYVAPTTSQSSTLQTVASSSSQNNGYIGQPWTVQENNVEPTTTAAAATTAVTSTSVAANGAVVVHTNIEYVTQISTVIVTARDAEPTPAPHKRHVHGHPHGGR